MNSCPACGWPGAAYGHGLLRICPNPECPVFAWTLASHLKLAAERVLKKMTTREESQ